MKPPEKDSPSGVNDIMGRLEQAIAVGNHKEAAALAKEVSKLQISTKLAQKESSKNRKSAPIKQEKIKYSDTTNQHYLASEIICSGVGQKW